MGLLALVRSKLGLLLLGVIWLGVGYKIAVRYGHGTGTGTTSPHSEGDAGAKLTWSDAVPAAAEDTAADHANLLKRLADAAAEVEKLKGALADSKSQMTESRRQLAAAIAAKVDCPAAAPCPRDEACDKAPSSTVKHVQGELYQQLLPLTGDASIPLVGKYFHPWRTRLGARKAVLLGEQPGIASNETDSCRTLDVVFQRPNRGRCTMIVDQQNIWKDTYLAPNIISFRMNTTSGSPELIANRKARAGTENQPHMDQIKKRDRRIIPFLTALPNMIAEVMTLLGDVPKKLNPKPLVVMATNYGHCSMVINWFCGLRKHKIPFPDHIVFAATKSLAELLTKLGITSYWHMGLGDFPKNAAATYGNQDFGIMMMLKQFSVQIALGAGRDVLFQDVDVTWLSDPLPDLVAGATYHHAQFQDDGGRGAVFYPYFANSGFFYLRNDRLTMQFWDAVTMAMPGTPSGNQIVVAHQLELFTRRHEFSVRILSREEYPSGRFIDHPLGMKDGVVRPTHDATMIMHFCWTHNLTDKVHKMNAYGEMHITKDCMMEFDECDTTVSSWDKMCTV